MRERSLYVVGGIRTDLDLRINNPDINTLNTALLTRMYYCLVDGTYQEPPTPLTGFYDEMGYLADYLTRYVGKRTRLAHRDVVQMYKGRKRTIYESALAQYQHSGLSRVDAFSNTFVKCEKVNPTKAPRCIQPRKPVYNLCLGAFIKPIEHKLYRAVDALFGSPTIMKGYNIEEVGNILNDHWGAFAVPVAIGLDATKFDMHVSPEALEWEHGIYRTIFNKSAALSRLLDWQMNNIGRGHCVDGKLKYKVRGKRFSGDMNTALGNCLIMSCLVKRYADSLGIDIRLANNGDDCVVFMESYNIARFSEGVNTFFYNGGFRLTTEEPVYNLAEVEFCQMHPIRATRGVKMVRNIPIAISKDTLSVIPLHTRKAMTQWMAAVGECGLAVAGDIPILRDFYNLYHRTGTPSNIKAHAAMDTGMARLAVGLISKYEDILPETRADVYTAWGYTPDHQVAIEEYYKNTNIIHSITPCTDYSQIPTTHHL